MLTKRNEVAGFQREVLQHAALCRRSDPDFSYTAACFGPRFGEEQNVNWSLAPLQKEEDARRPENLELIERLRLVLQALDVTNAYAPSPVKFNAAYVPQGFLKDRIPLGGNVFLFRNQSEPADASLLEHRDAGVFSGAGCMLIVATNGREFLFAHGGRDSLIDRVRFENSNRAWRMNESVCNTLVNTLGGYPRTKGSIKVEMHFAIPPRRYPHPLTKSPYAPFNRALYTRWGGACGEVENNILYLDLPRLARAQLIELGVPKENININRAYLPQNAWTKGAKGFPRNFAVVVREN